MASRRRVQARRSASRWAPFGLVEVERHLLVVLAGRFGDSLPLALEQFDHAALFSIQAFRESFLRNLRELGCAALQMRQQIGDVALRGSGETRPDWTGHAIPSRFVERRLQGNQGRLLARPARKA